MSPLQREGGHTDFGVDPIGTISCESNIYRYMIGT